MHSVRRGRQRAGEGEGPNGAREGGGGGGNGNGGGGGGGSAAELGAGLDLERALAGAIFGFLLDLGRKEGVENWIGAGLDLMRAPDIVTGTPLFWGSHMLLIAGPDAGCGWSGGGHEDLSEPKLTCLAHTSAFAALICPGV